MSSAEPEVFLVARPSAGDEAVAAYRREVGGAGTWVPGWRKG
jgi:hypothetical protein